MSIVHTTCTRDCPDACAVIAHVENGRLVRLEGDANHRSRAGFCAKRPINTPHESIARTAFCTHLSAPKGVAPYHLG
jgi:hypothetical protein